MKVLITGATGFIGKNLALYLLEKDIEIHCLVRNSKINVSKYLLNNIELHFYDGSIDSIMSIFQNIKFDGVIHLASKIITQHNNDDIDDLLDSNIKLGVYLLEASKATLVKWFINTGTFWQNYNDENYNPVNLYAATKQAFSQLGKYYTETSDLIFTTIKLSDTFGANDTRPKFMNLLLEASKYNRSINATEGMQLVDVSYIKDVISAYYILLTKLNSNNAQQLNNQEFVISNNEIVSLRELALLFQTISGINININWGAVKYRNREIMVPCSKGVTVPGWNQRYTLEMAIKEFIELSGKDDNEFK